jgi:hypothetical protein
LRETIGTMEKPYPTLVTSSIERLSNLLAEAEPILLMQEKSTE